MLKYIFSFGRDSSESLSFDCKILAILVGAGKLTEIGSLFLSQYGSICLVRFGTCFVFGKLWSDLLR